MPLHSAPPDDLHELLAWLHSDKEIAILIYVDIRHSLVNFFTWNRCPDAEDLADETIARVTRRVRQLAATYVGQPSLYFFGVAKNVLLEQHHPKPSMPLEAGAQIAAPPGRDEDELAGEERRHDCFEQCLALLGEDDRELAVGYYEFEGQAKIDNRKALALARNLSVATLRVHVYRIRADLRKCVEECLGRPPKK